MNNTVTPLLLIVTRIRQLTSHIRAYELRTAVEENENKELPLLSAGSQINFSFTTKNGEVVLGCHPVFSIPSRRELYEIAVASNSDKISQQITENFSEGTQLVCNSITNNFYLHADASPSILIAGELGIATLLPIAQTLATRGRRLALHYVGMRRTDMAFVDELEKLFPRTLTIFSDSEDAQADFMKILSEAPAHSFIYACGPKKMIDTLTTNARLLGINQDRIQCEYFMAEQTTIDKTLVLELANSNKLIQVSAEESLLSAIRNAKVSVNFDCCVGDCGTCAVKILEGEADHRDHVLSDEQKSAGYVCICVSRAKTEKLILAL